MDSSACERVNIHPTAVVHPGATLADGVEVGPYAVIGDHVTIGRGTRVGTHAVIDGYTTLGEENEIFTGAVIGSAPQDLKYQGERSYLVIGHRNRFREYVTINPGTQGGGGKTTIGDHNLVMAYAHIAHDCVIGHHCIIANNAALAGHITMEDRAVIGGLVGVHQFARVGTLAIVGGCSKVNQDVPPYALCDGNPIKVYGLNVEGLRRFGMAPQAKALLKRAFRILFGSGLALSTAIERVERDVPSSPEVAHLLSFLRTSKRGVCR